MEVSNMIKKECFSLSKNYELLSRVEDEIDFEFDFNMLEYSFIAILLLKFDSNLNSTREKMVPSEVEDDEFWRNYFYAVECYKAELGVGTRIGDKIDHAERLRKREEMRVAQETAKIVAMQTQELAQTNTTTSAVIPEENNEIEM